MQLVQKAAQGARRAVDALGKARREDGAAGGLRPARACPGRVSEQTPPCVVAVWGCRARRPVAPNHAEGEESAEQWPGFGRRCQRPPLMSTSDEARAVLQRWNTSWRWEERGHLGEEHRGALESQDPATHARSGRGAGRDGTSLSCLYRAGGVAVTLAAPPSPAVGLGRGDLLSASRGGGIPASHRLRLAVLAQRPPGVPLQAIQCGGARGRGGKTRPQTEQLGARLGLERGGPPLRLQTWSWCGVRTYLGLGNGVDEGRFRREARKGDARSGDALRHGSWPIHPLHTPSSPGTTQAALAAKTNSPSCPPTMHTID
ncbi:uncharacterized protein BDZ99DRAFT_497211 [Mytilinidion resinicola]|uniref:Uncharacterized protein n=1 Tax=Mytilinidion resinicola TaxID=574789 RepID=A0A6A6YRQ3_9PEZI|nr:uncharacterized protein BDZ99DRAFT_497211 [Mytilinidion resinicola]KAF2811451.1 hypothetical protein BDZ99DRAFT_497211 [Mytilinidion resinicola]